jgi:hypothetical protein
VPWTLIDSGPLHTGPSSTASSSASPTRAGRAGRGTWRPHDRIKRACFASGPACTCGAGRVGDVDRARLARAYGMQGRGGGEAA